MTLRRDVGHYLVYYLEENKGRFPGIDVRDRSSCAAIPTAAAPPTSLG